MVRCRTERRLVSLLAKTPAGYLAKADGPKELADKKDIFVVRVDGSVVGKGASSLRLQPGDSFVVPDKVAGGSTFWKNLMIAVQLMSSVAITSRVLVGF